MSMAYNIHAKNYTVSNMNVYRSTTYTVKIKTNKNSGHGFHFSRPGIKFCGGKADIQFEFITLGYTECRQKFQQRKRGILKLKLNKNSRLSGYFF
jgi:hypothetical protein